MNAIYLWFCAGNLGTLPSFEDLITKRLVKEVAFSGNRNRAAALTTKGSLYTYRRHNSTWAPFDELVGPGKVRSLVWSLDGSTLSWISNASEVSVWKPETGQRQVIGIYSRSGGMTTLATSPDGKWLASSAVNQVSWGEVLIPSTFRRLGSNSNLISVAFTSRNSFMVAGRSIEIWPVKGNNRRKLSVKSDYVAAIKPNVSSTKIAALTFASDIDVRSLPDGSLLKKISVGDGYPISIDWSHDERLLVCELGSSRRAGDSDALNRVQLFSLPSGRRISARHLREEEVGRAILDPYLPRVFLINESGPLLVWRINP